VEGVKDESAAALKDSEHAIGNAGRKNLRSVQDANNEAVKEAGDKLAQQTDIYEQTIVAGVRNETAMGKNQMNYDALKTRQDTSEHLDAAGRKTTAYYIHMAKIGLEPLKEKMQESGEQMTAELHNTIVVSENVERVVDKVAAEAWVHANYSARLWATTQRSVRAAQIAANVSEDQVRISAMGTKFSTQAVSKAKEMARKAFDLATEANLTGNMIIKKVMKTKSGIVDVTAEVNDALKKASTANIDAHQADLVATKLNRDALSLR
jgi:hypothetical protein